MESKGMDIKGYLRLLHKRKGLFMVTAMVIMTSALLISYLSPKKYEAHSTILIEKNVISEFVEGIAVTPSMEERIKAFSEAILNRSLLLKVIERVDFNIDRNNQEEVARLLEHLKNNTIVKKQRRSDVFTVSFRHRDPELARNYVNTLVNLFIEENLEAKRQEAYGANRFLKEQIRFFKDRINEAERKIVEFRRSKGIIIAMDERTLVSDIDRLQKELDELQIKKMELNAQERQIEEQLRGEKPYTVALLDEGEMSYADRLTLLEKRLHDLLLKYTENYPEVIQLKAEIESLKKKMQSVNERRNGTGESTATGMSAINPIYLKLKERLSQIQSDMAALEAKERYLKREIAIKKSYLKDIPAERKKLADLERERDTYKEIYEKLLFRLGQSEVSKQMEVQDKAESFKILEPAVTPLTPVSPDRKRILLLGIFGGVGGAFSLLLLLDYFDKTVKTTETVKALGGDILALIPIIEDPVRKAKSRRKNIVLFTIFTLYMCFILSVFAIEFLGLTYVDEIFSKLNLSDYLLSIKEII